MIVTEISLQNPSKILFGKYNHVVETLASDHRARLINPKDQWISPTLLGAAFDTGDTEQAKQLHREILREGPGSFQLNSTIPDLEKSLALQAGSETYHELQNVLDELKELAN